MPIAAQLADALRSSVRQGPRALMSAVGQLDDPDARLLVLWTLHREEGDPECGRVLAMLLNGTDTGTSRGCRLWLMNRDAIDLGIAHTLCSWLHREVIEHARWPSYVVGESLPFLTCLLKHAEVSLRAEALSLLAAAARRNLLGTFVHAAGAKPLAHLLRTAVSDFGDDDELERSDKVCAQLASASLPLVPRRDPRSLQRVVLDLLDSADRYAGVVSEIEPLIELVRERALFDDAAAQALHARRPLQTLRVKASHSPTRLVQAVLGFGEAVIGAERDPDFSDKGVPDYGIELGWAPAASVPIHLTYEDDDAVAVFDALSLLTNADKVDAAVSEMDPEVVSAFLRLVERLQDFDGDIELILTDPKAELLQKTITINAGTIRTSLALLAKQSRVAARGRKIVVPKDQVPQANTVQQVFQAVDAMLERGIVTPNDIDGINSARQVLYYKQGARVLGFFDTDNQPTARARTLVGLDLEKRLAVTSVYFEDSPVGRAWRAWAGVDKLKQVDPATAQEFLEACTIGLNGTTPGRRASTLRAWYQELIPRYPG